MKKAHRVTRFGFKDGDALSKKQETRYEYIIANSTANVKFYFQKFYFVVISGEEKKYISIL